MHRNSVGVREKRKAYQFFISKILKNRFFDKSMMSPRLLSSNPAANSSTRRSKKKKIQNQSHNDNQSENSYAVPWKSDVQQQIYSSKLLNALQQVRRSNAQTPAAPKRVRDAAYRVLAATAKGRSRWSRAILTNRLKLKFMKKKNIVKRQRKVMTLVTTGGNRAVRKKSKVSVLPLRLKSKSLPAVQRKSRVLGRLVPGCRKEPLPVVLEEAADYIAALEMQVRAMSALAELLSVSGSSSSGSSTMASSSGDNMGTPSA